MASDAVGMISFRETSPSVVYALSSTPPSNEW